MTAVHIIVVCDCMSCGLKKFSIAEALAASVISAVSDIPAIQMKWLRLDCALLMRLHRVQ
jgi:hypothetical protein